MKVYSNAPNKQNACIELQAAVLSHFCSQGDKLRAIGPKDEADKAIAALIEKGTCEELLGPDWQCCFELVDLVNSQPQ